MSDKVSPIQFRVDKELKNYIKENADIRNMSVSELIKTALLHYISETNEEVRKEIIKKESIISERVDCKESTSEEIVNELRNIKSNKIKYLQIYKDNSSELYQLIDSEINGDVFTAVIAGLDGITINIKDIHCVFNTKLILNIYIKKSNTI